MSAEFTEDDGLRPAEDQTSTGPRTFGKRVELAARRVIVTIIGVVVILAGIAMLFLPGQGILTIVAGLAILATEYTWAKRLYRWAKQRSREVYEGAKDRIAERRRDRASHDPDHARNPDHDRP